MSTFGNLPDSYASYRLLGQAVPVYNLDSVEDVWMARDVLTSYSRIHAPRGESAPVATGDFRTMAASKLSRSTRTRPALIAVGACVAVGLVVLASPSLAQQPDTTAQQSDSPASATGLKALSVEELMNVVVTSVSRRAEPLSHAASSIQVITQEDIRRSSATSLPEALRLGGALSSKPFELKIAGTFGVTPARSFASLRMRSVYPSDFTLLTLVPGPWFLVPSFPSRCLN